VTAVVACAAVSRPYEFATGLAGIENSLMAGGLGHWVLPELAAHLPKTRVKSTLAEEGRLTKAETAALVDHVWSDEYKRELVLGLSATIPGHRKAGLKNDHARFPGLGDPRGRAPAECGELVPVALGTHLAVWIDPTAADLQARIVAHFAG
jgi:hypothetical protein